MEDKIYGGEQWISQVNVIFKHFYKENIKKDLQNNARKENRK